MLLEPDKVNDVQRNCPWRESNTSQGDGFGTVGYQYLSNYCLFCHFPDYIHFKTNKEVCFKLNIFPACVMKILYLVYVQISSNSLNYIAQTIW